MESTERKSNAQENLNTVLGSIGTAGAVGLLGGNGLNLFGNNNRPPAGDPPWSRDMNYERELTEKDAKIGKLESQIYTDQQVLALERRVDDKLTRINERINTETAAQNVLNAKQQSFLDVIASKVASFDMMTSRYINQPVMAASEAALAWGRSAFSSQSSGTTSTATAGA